MEAFYLIVLSIALLILILILTYIGVKMSSKEIITTPFPPVMSTCPDYWRVDGSYCVVPINGSKNTGDIYDANGTVSLSSTPGVNGNTVNFGDQGWVANGVNPVCSQKTWSNLHGIQWDGVSNYNSC
jgi:hypothetical protein